MAPGSDYSVVRGLNVLLATLTIVATARVIAAQRLRKGLTRLTDADQPADRQPSGFGDKALVHLHQDQLGLARHEALGRRRRGVVVWSCTLDREVFLSDDQWDLIEPLLLPQRVGQGSADA